MTYTIKQIANDAGVSTFSIIYWEKRGVIPKPNRTDNFNHSRVYTEKDREAIILYSKSRFIKRPPDANARRIKHRKLSRAGMVRQRFNLTLEEYDALREASKVCAICRKPMTGTHRTFDSPVLDHDHITGKYREFVHSKCNRGLGLFDDDPVRLRLAAEYIEKHQAKISH